ncbi:HTH-type transcriptional regulator GlnR [bacterium BMS3Abin07]|nr:HTH-type transcriptional regulator GlnR [bacterium BMS3Abin07]GBE32606.1 HTH-type transcriptional regulator GlnR [bacterium BMS3Bbin05]HDO23301.1 MerR family transcriptional regulator [Nitrospirota bacterium]HDZ87036.1 MerR family transcriptional regulator [Nitrospirota bacterium]
MKKKRRADFTDEEKKGLPLYPIGIVAELVGTTDQTLRLYEKHGLIKPARRNKNRYYSENDIKWLRCIRDLIHDKKISIEGIKKLLEYAPCWEITVCSEERKSQCSAFIDKTKPCWELNRMICNKESGKICEDCVVYLSRKIKAK